MFTQIPYSLLYKIIFTDNNNETFECVMRSCPSDSKELNIALQSILNKNVTSHHINFKVNMQWLIMATATFSMSYLLKSGAVKIQLIYTEQQICE